MRQELLRERLCSLSYSVEPPLTISEPCAPNSGISVALIKWKFFMTGVQSEEQHCNSGRDWRLFLSIQNH